jgi:ferric-dicitrate binding protein FerR (iron transport regulator)
MKDQIDDIIKKGKPETATWKDKQEMYSLFHQADKEYIVKDKLLEELHTGETGKTTSPDYKKLFARLWAKIEQTQQQPKAKVRQLSTLLKIAAAVVVGLFVGMYVSSVKPKSEPVYYAAHSPKGSVSEMILPDGSVIFLNADSRIRYSVDGQNGVREVFLTGEAWFDVGKNEKRPFIVHTPFYDVNVTGTRFNVKAYESDNEVTTTLEEGQVVIGSAGNVKLAEDIVLKPGEQITLDRETMKMAVKTVNPKWFTSWKDNKLIFVNMSMKELVVLLERKYGVDIDIKNTEILALHFDGTIKNESIIEILEIIKNALPINYKIVGQKIEITGRKTNEYKL